MINNILKLNALKLLFIHVGPIIYRMEKLQICKKDRTKGHSVTCNSAK